TVADEGPGVAPEDAARIFERFHRVDAARARTDGGSGLGLAIAQAVVVAHGGRIWIDEAEQGGCVVAFEIPREEPVL
ncbi:MAG TPA: ATP-binding protein, partial [Actinomycetota bacterium]|nr:ATP-binding protein [Actinomycetota bacterium]